MNKSISLSLYESTFFKKKKNSERMTAQVNIIDIKFAFDILIWTRNVHFF